MAELVFEGPVRVYLEGKNALLPTGKLDDNIISYFLGSRRSSLTIRDFRSRPIRAAHHILSGQNGIEFADIFNEPALVKVYTNKGTKKLDIELHETLEADKSSTLWLGVTDNNEMTVQDIEWEVLRPIGKQKTAFVALVK